MSTDARALKCVHRSQRAHAVAAALFVAGLLSGPAWADRSERGAQSEVRQERVCTLSEWNRVDVVSRAYCLASDGELSCTADARWRCCRAGGDCIDGGALDSARPHSLRNDEPAEARSGGSEGARSQAAPRSRGLARRRRDH